MKVGEFIANEQGTLTLTQFGIKALGQEGTQVQWNADALSRRWSKLQKELTGFEARELEEAERGKTRQVLQEMKKVIEDALSRLE